MYTVIQAVHSPRAVRFGENIELRFFFLQILRLRFDLRF